MSGLPRARSPLALEENTQPSASSFTSMITPSEKHTSQPTPISLAADGPPAHKNDELEKSVDIDELEPDVREYRTQLNARLWLWAPCLLISYVASGMDESIQVAANAPVGAEFYSLNIISWVGTAWFIGVITGYPLWCTLCDIYGRKTPIVLAQACYLLGLFLSGFASSMVMLIVGRAFQGLGAAGAVCLGSIIVADTFTLQYRGYAEGVLCLIFSACGAVGPVIGGAISDRIGWRWVYRIQIPCAFIGIVGALCFIPTSRTHLAHDIWLEVRRINIPGLIAFIGGTIAMYVAFDHGSNLSWADPAAYVSLVVALLLFLAFVLSEKRHPNPYIPKLVLHERSLIGACLLNFLCSSGALSVLYYLPLYWQAVRGLSVLHSSLLVLPITIGSGIAGILATFWFWRLKEFKKLMLFGSGLAALGVLALVLVTHFAAWGSMVGVSIAVFCLAVGMVWTVITSTMALNAHTPSSNTVPAFRAMFLARGFGTGLGISVMSLIVQMSLTARLRKLGLSANTITSIRQSLTAIPLDLRSRTAYGLAIADAFIWTTVVVVLFVPVSVMVRGKSLARKE